MTPSGTGLAGYRRYVGRAEAHRLELVQLNRLRAKKARLAEDGDRKRVDCAS